jgi:GNAT superfamily N-acetyltransferase
MKAIASPATDLLAAYDEQLRIQIEYPEARKETTKDVVRFARRPPGMNFVSYTFTGDDDVERVIDEQLEYFLPMEQPFTWKVYAHDRRAGLEEKLVRRGFVCEDSDPGEIMVLEVDQAPTALLQPVGADIRRIDDRDQLEDVVTILDRVYGNDNAWVYDRLGGHLELPGYLSIYLAYADGQPAAVAWTYFPRGEFALLFAGSTLAEYRNQGLYTGLLATRLQEIRERGYRVAVVEAGSMSRPIVAKHGFRYLTTLYDYEWTPSPTLPQIRDEQLD